MAVTDRGPVVVALAGGRRELARAGRRGGARGPAPLGALLIAPESPVPPDE